MESHTDPLGGAFPQRRTLVATVTYGKRLNFLRETLQGARVAGATHYLVISNGLEGEVVVELQKLMDEFTPSVMTCLDKNLGSAGGFAAAFERACDLDVDDVWFLDDDNRPQPNSLIEARTALQNLQMNDPGGRFGIVCHRSDLRRHAQLKAGISVGKVFDTPGSFLHFNLKKFFDREAGANVQAVIPVPSGPYGGLLLSRSDLVKFDPPRKEMVLYEDDTEFTERLRAGGVGLYYVAAAVVDDVSVSDRGPHEVQGSRTSFAGPTRLLQTSGDWKAKTYYQVRNTLWLDRRRVTRTDCVLFVANGLIYVAVCAILAINPQNRSNIGFLARAIRDGLVGRLEKTIELS